MNRGDAVKIYTEGSRDADVLAALLSRAFPNLKPVILAVNQSLSSTRGGVKSKILEGIPEGSIVVFDLEEGAIRDAVDKNYLAGDRNLVMCPAIPTVEGWLLADVEWATSVLELNDGEALSAQWYGERSEVTNIAIRRVKQALKTRRLSTLIRVSSEFNVNRAMTLSPSFAHFIEAVQHVNEISVPAYSRTRELASSMDRTIFASLVGELRPLDQVVYRSLGKQYSAGELKSEIMAGTVVGISYMENVLRVARDLLSFEAEDDSDEAGE